MLSGHKNLLTFKKIIWFTAIVLLVAFTLVKAINSSTLTKVSPPIVIGYSNSPSWWPWTIVENQQLFLKKGINAELKWYDNYSDSVRDLNSGFIDGNSQLTEDTVSSSSVASRKKAAVLLNSYSDGEDKIIVREGINKIEDLVGKKILVEVASEENQLLDLTLASASVDISLNDLELSDLETGIASAAFAVDQSIDAVVSFPPYSTIALSREGSHELVTSKTFPQAISRILVVDQDLVNNHSKIVEDIADSWYEAVDFIKKSPQEANRIISERLGIKIEDLKQFQQQVSLVNRKINSQNLSEITAKLYE